jgi:2-phospho-L-lactate guanylyltransferase
MTPPIPASPVPPTGVGVGAVVALKAGEFVKSRLAPLPQPLRRRLAWTMAVDTLHALTQAVEHVCVVSDQPGLAHRLARAGLGVVEVVPESRPTGLNDALRLGADRLRSDGLARVLACVGDLPALRPASVGIVLRVAAAYERAYLPDATGIGTTMLHAGPGVPLAPHFQGRSAAAHHSSGAVALTDPVLARPVPDARRDVDTEVDLADAIRLGLGPASPALVDPATGRLGDYAVVTVVRPEPDGRAVTASGVRVDLPAGAPSDGLRTLRPGQRLHAVLAGSTVLSAWL